MTWPVAIAVTGWAIFAAVCLRQSYLRSIRTIVALGSVFAFMAVASVIVIPLAPPLGGLAAGLTAGLPAGLVAWAILFHPVLFSALPSSAARYDGFLTDQWNLLRRSKSHARDAAAVQNHGELAERVKVAIQARPAPAGWTDVRSLFLEALAQIIDDPGNASGDTQAAIDHFLTAWHSAERRDYRFWRSS